MPINNAYVCATGVQAERRTAHVRDSAHLPFYYGSSCSSWSAFAGYGWVRGTRSASRIDARRGWDCRATTMNRVASRVRGRSRSSGVIVESKIKSVGVKAPRRCCLVLWRTSVLPKEKKKRKKREGERERVRGKEKRKRGSERGSFSSSWRRNETQRGPRRASCFFWWASPTWARRAVDERVASLVARTALSADRLSHNEMWGVTYLSTCLSTYITSSQNVILLSRIAAPIHVAHVSPRVQTETASATARAKCDRREAQEHLVPIRIYMGTWGTRIAVASTPVHRSDAKRWGLRAPRATWRNTYQRVGLALIICNISVNVSRRTVTLIRHCIHVQELSSWSVPSKLLRVSISWRLTGKVGL